MVDGDGVRDEGMERGVRDEGMDGVRDEGMERGQCTAL